GGITLILKKAPGVPDIITGGGNTVAVRVPGHPVPLALIRGLGEPVCGTSANLTGMPAGKSAGEVKEQLANLVDFIIEEGPPPAGIESTIVDATGNIPFVIREGALSRAEIFRVLKGER
ncbi:MAG: L-threonylcarbamoyladenylate synthase, partial [Dehalococcoidia bacterium]|nr:L-threonylcarbamoyladenylate synthase [Dehalococcoidia bacterium]